MVGGAPGDNHVCCAAAVQTVGTATHWVHRAHHIATCTIQNDLWCRWHSTRWWLWFSYGCVCVLHLFELASIEELASQGGGQVAVMQGNRVTVSL